MSRKKKEDDAPPAPTTVQVTVKIARSEVDEAEALRQFVTDDMARDGSTGAVASRADVLRRAIVIGLREMKDRAGIPGRA